THRQTALAELLTLRRAIRAAGTTGEMTLALADFLDAVQLRERLAREAEARLAAGENQMAQELRQLYDILRDCLEQLWLALGPTPRTPDGFVRLVRPLLSQYAVGTIPAGLDQVLAGPLPDLRQRRTKHLLVLGTADGAFPAYRGAEGLLTEEERRRLLAQGISLAPSRADQLDQEMGRIAAALAAAEETIALSYTRSEEHTSELQSRFDLVCRLLLEKKKIQSFMAKALKWMKQFPKEKTWLPLAIKKPSNEVKKKKVCISFLKKVYKTF